MNLYFLIPQNVRNRVLQDRFSRFRIQIASEIMPIIR